MISKITRGYGRLFSAAAKVLLLLALCTGLGSLIVIPLYEAATHEPKAYTMVVLILIAAILVITLIRRARDKGIRSFLISAGRIFIIACGAAGCIFFVLDGKRLLALPVLVLTFILYGIVSFGIHQKENNVPEHHEDQDSGR